MKHKMSSVKFIIPLVVFLILVLSLWQGLKKDPHMMPSALIGRPMPQFTLASANHPQTVLTNNIFKGQVSLLNVFASWCITCRAEHAVMMDIHDQHVVRMYGLAYKDSRAQLLPWLHQFGDPYAQVIDDSQGQLAINLGVYGTPETFIIDQKGIIRYKHVGAVSPTLWQDQLQPLILKLNQSA